MVLVELEESVGMILWVGTRANREASRNRERRRDLRRDVEFEGRAWRTPGERLENKSWRVSRDLADVASGKSHRSVSEEREGGKETVNRLYTVSVSSTPLTLFFRVLLFFAETNRIDPVPVL